MGKSAVKTPKFETILKWHEKNMCFDLNIHHEIARPALSAARYDDNTKALISANGYALQITWGDFSAQADSNGWVKTAKSADVNETIRFPDVWSIIPDHYDYELNVTVGQFEQAVKLARIFGRDSGDSIMLALCPNDDVIAVIGSSAERGDCVSHVAVMNHSAAAKMPLVILLDASYVAAALSGFSDQDMITVKANHWNSPVEISNGERLALIMPKTNPEDSAKTLAEFAQKILDMIDYSMSTDYSPVKSFKKSSAHKGDKYEIAQRQARDLRELASAALVRDIDAPFVRGSWIPAEVTHDSQMGLLTDVMHNARIDLLWNVEPEIVLQVSPKALRVITHSTSYGGHIINTFTFTLHDGVTSYSLQRHDLQYGITKQNINGDLPFAMNVKSFITALQAQMASSASSRAHLVIMKRQELAELKLTNARPEELDSELAQTVA